MTAPALVPTSQAGERSQLQRLVDSMGRDQAIEVLFREPLSAWVESALPADWRSATVGDALAYRREGAGDRPLCPWSWIARPKQLAPSGDWIVFLMQCGRGFGKTRGLSGFVLDEADHAGRLVAEGKLSSAAANIIVIAPTAADLRTTVVEGDSGLLQSTPPWMEPAVYEPTKRLVSWPNGTRAVLISADEADRVRGVQGTAAALDEAAVYPQLAEVMSNVRMAVRLGDRPRICIATTPRNSRELRAIIEARGTVITRGHSGENSANLGRGVIESLVAEFGGTHRGRQELDGELIGSSEFALWKAEEIESHRVRRAPEDLKRVVVAVDPSGTSHGSSDECGIVAVGTAVCTCRGAAEVHAFVLEDCSLRAAPEVWARQAVRAYERHRADVICAETNFGADLVEATIRTVSANVSFKKLTASRGKERRAEPIASLSAQGKIHFVGAWPLLEDQLTTWSPLYDKWSPDRLDAFVWAVSELDLGHQAATYESWGTGNASPPAPFDGSGGWGSRWKR